MIKEKIWVSKKIKNKKNYPRRTRRSRDGELEQIDMVHIIIGLKVEEINVAC